VEKDFKAEEWATLTASERIALCRQFAADATRLSVEATDAFRPLYMDLANQWNRLADAIARAGGIS